MLLDSLSGVSRSAALLFFDPPQGDPVCFSQDLFQTDVGHQLYGFLVGDEDSAVELFLLVDDLLILLVGKEIDDGLLGIRLMLQHVVVDLPEISHDDRGDPGLFLYLT